MFARKMSVENLCLGSAAGGTVLAELCWYIHMNFTFIVRIVQQCVVEVYRYVLYNLHHWTSLQ